MIQRWRYLLLFLLSIGLTTAFNWDYLEDWDCSKFDCVTPAGEDCPSNSTWMPKIAANGCCGACVRFLQEFEMQCTGRLDEHSCGGEPGDSYGLCEPPDPSTLLRQRHMTRLGAMWGVKPVEEVIDDVVVYKSYWCDKGMTCSNTNINGIIANYCILVQDWITCANTRDAYDRDLQKERFVEYRDDYRWRPECDIDGTYAPKQCKSSFRDFVTACVCVDPSGKDIPGKAFSFQKDLYDNMNCLCSRRMYELEQAGVQGVTLHCQANGNYDPLQCQNGWCFCVHPENGTINGYQMPESTLNFLPCYNSSNTGQLYLRKCDSQQHAHYQYAQLMALKGVKIFPAQKVTCNYDGSFHAQQCTGSFCRCYNKYGTTCNIDGYNGCNCYRDLLTYEEYGQSYTTITCAIQEGRYDPKQIWTSSSSAFYVDEEGFRIGPVVRENCIDKSYVSVGDVTQCQLQGNLNDTIMGIEKDYCDQVCESCPENAFFYNEKYSPSLTCINNLK